MINKDELREILEIQTALDDKLHRIQAIQTKLKERIENLERNNTPNNQ